jgi:hypothetical protein
VARPTRRSPRRRCGSRSGCAVLNDAGARPILSRRSSAAERVRICANKVVAGVRGRTPLRNIRFSRTRVIASVRVFCKLEGLAPARALRFESFLPHQIKRPAFSGPFLFGAKVGLRHPAFALRARPRGLGSFLPQRQNNPSACRLCPADSTRGDPSRTSWFPAISHITWQAWPRTASLEQLRGAL